MKYKFKPNSKPYQDWKDWVEETAATPADQRASFFIKDLRKWMLRWVFK